MKMKKLVFISIFIIMFICFFRQANSFAKSGSVKAGAYPKTTPNTQLKYPYYLKRDPFQTFLYTPKHVTSFKAGEQPLLQYSISSLKVVGIMSRRGKYFAMIQTPDGRSYIITVGSLVGVNRARVVSINGSEVNLAERTYNILGQMRSVNVVMSLK